MKQTSTRFWITAPMASCLLLSLSAPVVAKVDLVTLPERGACQLTIYNSADMTLVKETRKLTLSQGINQLQFGWANTLIDPTSLEMVPKAKADSVDIMEIIYPPRVHGVGIWKIDSRFSGEIPFEITYFASGITWRAYYLSTLSTDEKTLQLQGYVRVLNHSGEDYPQAQTRLIVGKINQVDAVANLAARQEPYGRPDAFRLGLRGQDAPMLAMTEESKSELKRAVGSAEMMDYVQMAPKEIIKEGLSEYFLYTIEGTESIDNGWSKRLPSFEQEEIPVKNLYKYERERYGEDTVRFLHFKNDEDHKLGKEPLPDGLVKVFRLLDEENHLEYVGSQSVRYIPIGEDVELRLGPTPRVRVKPVLMDYKQTQFQFDNHGNVSGWDDEKDFTVTVKNHRDLPVQIEIRFNLDHPYWDLQCWNDVGKYEKIDLDTYQFTLDLEARSEQKILYHLVERRGTRTH